MEVLIFYVLLTLLISFLCSLMEASLLSIPESFVEMKLQEGKAFARHLKAMKTDIDRPLAAILSLNTIANTIGASGVGVQASVLFPETSPLIFSSGLTIAILVFSEIIPKTIGASYAQSLAGFTVATLRGITFIMSPLVWMTGFITRLLKRNKQQSVFSRAEFFAMTEVGAKEGIFRKEEFQIIKNLLQLNSIRVSDIMTPRTVMLAADENTLIRDFYAKHPKLRFSRIPIFRDNIDNITGYVLKSEILEHIINQKENEPLVSLKRDIIFIHDTLTLPEIFNKFMQEREHIAIVVDEYGGVAGLVTMEDCVETLLGTEIMDELDNIEDLQQWARKSWEQRAARFGIQNTPPPDEN